MLQLKQKQYKTILIIVIALNVMLYVTYNS